MKVSLLDRSRTRVDAPEGEALHNTVRRARSAEALGYHRFWVAEHHAVPGIASGSPAVLLAAIGGATRRIRLGSGGVMLPQHRPLVVAEQFRMLEALHPGRIDLGIGRSLGFTAPVRRALGRERAPLEEFQAELRELQAFLDDTGEITARPRTGPVPVFALATGSGADVAARLGLPLVLGGPSLLDPDLPRLLDRYRERFVAASSPTGARSPYVVLSLSVFIADSEDRARELALPEAWAMARSRQTGEFPPLESPERIRAQPWSPRVRERMDQQLEQVLAGEEDAVADQLRRLVSRTAADELLAATSTYDTAALRELDAALKRVADDL
ncbi:MsnO8 family LLM class oxidoreductase [Gulosibacter sp. 10]|uniref:MsnO8 family LLM class oxidoreductase n=1 Tax=Gulosibacter sp. 10 TaxID=1255570 RepID=UPI00097EB995|nr:MsnO8 family LLM class oxidoreductase [Gulosibacter sp. 10]SJM66129.1 hypothetical protein FM112_11525 [Gulosibacter sp. 10]